MLNSLDEVEKWVLHDAEIAVKIMGRKFNPDKVIYSGKKIEIPNYTRISSFEVPTSIPDDTLVVYIYYKNKVERQNVA